MSKIAGLLVMFAYPRLPDWQAATRTRAQDFSGQLWPNHGGGMQVNPVDVFTLPLGSTDKRALTAYLRRPGRVDMPFLAVVRPTFRSSRSAVWSFQASLGDDW